MSEIQESLEWRSVLDAVQNVNVREALLTLDQSGSVAYTDGACIKNPGGPAGWSALLWAAVDADDGKAREDAPRLEVYGHIPKAPTTTNNRAEIAAVLAVLSIAPPALPLTIYSDSEYTIKVASGVYRMTANSDLWGVYRKLLSYRKEPPEFIWVRGHAGHIHNERADELAGLGAFNKDRAAYEQWQAAQAPEARNAVPTADLARMRAQAQRLNTLFEGIAVESGRVGELEREFVSDMVKRFQRKNYMPTEKQSNWLKRLAVKYKI